MLLFKFISLNIVTYIRGRVTKIQWRHICGVIKQNQSEVGQFQFSFFQLTVCTIFTATFCRKPHWNWLIGSKDMSSWRMPKTIGTKDIFYFVWLYLKINISDFRLILLDHITYNKEGNEQYLIFIVGTIFFLAAVLLGSAIKLYSSWWWLFRCCIILLVLPVKKKKKKKKKRERERKMQVIWSALCISDLLFHLAAAHVTDV